MKPLQELLEVGDPLVHEPRLDEMDVRAMRRTVIAAADDATAQRFAWRYAVAITVMAVVILAVISTLAQREAPEAEDSRAVAGLPPVEMQFSTPGGTRVIWVFDQSEAE